MGLGSFPGGAEEQHVEAKLLRPLTQNEKAYVKALLDEAARAIVSEVETPVDKWSEEFTARAGDVEMAPGSTLRVIARDWPGQAGTVFDWHGDRFEQAGPGKRMYGSPRTAHWEVLARHVGRIEGNG